MTDQPVEVSLARIHFNNFKAFREAVINLAPITVIAGVNSSGKSSILQGLLLARNTFASRDIGKKETPLVFDKPLPFTDFEELVFGYPIEKRKSKSADWHEMTLGFDMLIQLVAEQARQYFDISSETWIPVEIGIEVRFGRQDRKQQVMIRSVMLRASPRNNGNSAHSVSLLFEPSKNGLWNIVYQDHRQKMQIEQHVEFDRFLPIPEGWVLQSLSFLNDKRSPADFNANAKAVIYNVYTNLFGPHLIVLRELLSKQLHYIGPLRSAPQPSVTQQQIEGLDVGEAGEKTIQLLYDRIEEGKAVNFVRIPPSLDQFKLNGLSPVELDLKTGLYDALRLMGIEQRLKIQKQGVSYQASLSLHQEKRFVPITDVGFGISQVLPIVAVCLLAQPGDLLVFEQPEIHLHPRAQAGLADLLLCTALSGKQIIVETHSDHLINRLRRRLAEYSVKASAPLPDLVNLVFVSPPRSPGEGAMVENAQFDSQGNIKNWPPGFLAESAKEARSILRAQAALEAKKPNESDGV